MALIEHHGKSRLLLAVAVLVAVCLSVEASHYRGGTVSWKFRRYDPEDITRAEIEISHRIAWNNPPSSVYCTQARVETLLRIPGGVMTCSIADNSDATCPENTNTIDSARDFVCTDYNQGVAWSSGVLTTYITTSFPIGDSDPYYFGYSGCCWADDITGARYGLLTSMVLAPREDNGQINSAPITAMFPVVRVQRGCTEDIRIPIVDEDSDFVSCIQATDPDSKSHSCYSLCNNGVPNTIFNPADAVGSCTVRITASGSREHYGVAVVVQDSYTDGDSILSTVPLQFVVEFYGDDGNCLSPPTFVSSTPAFGSTVIAQSDSASGTVDIVVRSSAADQTITDIVTLSPLHTDKTALTDVVGSGGRESSITVTFRQGTNIMPHSFQGTDIMCFYGVQSNGVSTAVQCIIVSYGGTPIPDPCLTVPCSNDGTCTPISGNTDYQCQCPLGYEGNNCDEVVTPCEPLQCQNGGACVVVDIIDYRCDCIDGYLGENCQNANPCVPSPCVNDALCTALNENTDYDCNCPAGVLGKNCQIANPCDNSPCVNDAPCTALSENTDYRCTCPEEFVGMNCDIEVPVDPCTVDGICENGGTCNTMADFSYTCVCVPGYVGENCQDEFECPEGASYTACITGCDITSCMYPGPLPGCDSETCSEGCVCGQGLYLENDQCITTDQCGCVKDGQYYPLTTTLVNETCTEVCDCVSTGNFECQSLVCSDDASCQIRDDRYACVCDEGFIGNGLDCTPEALSCRVYDDQETCIGPECQVGCFSSPNYLEGPYTPNTIIQYIVQSSGANYYTVKCDERFRIEEDRDSLYVGPGDPPSITDLDIDPSYPVYLFDGDDAPERFLVNSSALWMYFITDKIVQQDGWRCCWKADDPCVDDPCMNDGRCQGRSDGTYMCVCVGSWIGDRCEIGRAQCSAHGDPHYTTFDDVRYDFQGACKYYLVRYCGEDEADYFEVIQQNRKVETNAKASTTESLWIQIFGYEIGLLQDKELMIDGILVLPPVALPGFWITLSGNKLVARFNNSLEVQWDGEKGVDIELSYDFSNQTCGLCGNMDWDREREFRTPDNMLVDDPVEFADSWKFNADCNADDDTNGVHPCGDGPPDEGALQYTALLFQSDGPLGVCFEEINPAPFIGNVFYDWCATQPDTSSVCADIANYASQCQARGIGIRQWRRENLCPLECPENSRYNPCMTACPTTCGDNRPEDFECLLPCVEGCQCDEGHVLDGDQRCVPEDQCGCIYEGFYRLASWTFLSNDCLLSCSCVDQSPVCNGNSCDANAFCGVADRRHGCHCNEDYIGDGFTCSGDPCSPNPCNNGRCELDEQAASGFYCICYRGNEGDLCDQVRGHCYAHGDPHYNSFDGVKFNYQGPCRYILMQPCDPGDGPTFRVIQENEKLRDSKRSPAVTKAVYVELGEVVFAMKEDKKLYINGILSEPPVLGENIQIVQRGKNLVLETAFGLEVRWNGKYEVDISLNSTYFNNTCGLCGNWNGNPDDEFGAFDNPEQFGNSWAVEGGECESNEEPIIFVCNPNPFVQILVEGVCSAIYLDAFSPCATLGLADAFYESCIFDLCTTYPEFPNFCPSLATYADLCQESGFPVRLWRSRDLCRLECPRRSHYSQCISACPPTCGQPQSWKCRIPCVEGCECDDGYILSGGDCVRPDDCGCQYLYYLQPEETHLNASCTELCTCNGQDDITCEPVSCHANGACMVRDGAHGCYCNEGYYGNGYECEQDPCSTGEEHCSGNGECIGNDDGTFHCECQRGWSGDYCDIGMALCSGHGDPHYESFDGSRFDYQGKCCYTLLWSTIEDLNISFTVVARNKQSNRNRQVSLTEELYIFIGDIRIDLLQDGEVRVNGMNARTPVYPWPGISIRRARKQLVLQTNFSLEIEWDGKNTFAIAVSADYFNRTYGLCGTYDENRDNDFTTSDHEIVEDVNTFGNSWLYGECETSEPPGDPYNPCEENGDRADMAREHCGIITDQEGPFRECHSTLNPEGYFESCTYDLCSTLPDRGALCDDIAKYADDCQGAGVSIEEWRSDDLCPFVCQEDASYNLCGSGCQLTCDDIRDNSTVLANCAQRCREGCQCEEGHVLSDRRCVRPEQCGCRYDGAYYLLGQSFFTDDCEQLCRCREGGEVECEELSCHENAVCSPVDGELQCRCFEPLIGDGIEECKLNPCLRNPCENYGVCQLDGDDYNCICNEWWTGRHCEIRLGVCLSYGSLHFNSYDGAAYSFVGECQYILSKTCTSNFMPSFEVVQENVRITPITSVIKALHIRVNNQMISLGRGRTCRVNGEDVELPISHDGIDVRIIGMNVVLRSDIQLEVSYDGWYSASVIVGPQFAGELCGLCGDFDGRYENDYIVSGSYVSGTGIGNFYRTDEECATPEESEFLDNGNPCENVSPHVRDEAESFCQGLVEGSLEACVTILNEELFKRRCLYDACESRLNPAIICLHPLKYARRCRFYGGQFEPWRRADYCSLDCPEGSHYNPEASTCPATCVDMLLDQMPSCDSARRVEACECDQDHFLSGVQCVPREECGCIRQGTYYQQGQVFLTEDCSMVCICQSHQVMCTSISCNENAYCAMSDGHRMCRCNEGFSGDGMECEASSCVDVTCENDGTCMPGRNTPYTCYCPPGFGGSHCEFAFHHCVAYGDPHYMTFSGFAYDFQGECKYYLIRNCKELEPYFDVIQHNERSLRNPHVTLTKAIWINLYDLKIGLFEDHKVTVNGLEILPPYSYEDLVQIYYLNDKVVVLTNFSLEVSWDGRHDVDIGLSVEWSNQTCGLCGDIGGTIDEEIVSYGEDDISTFGDLNKANPEECDSVTQPGLRIDCPPEDNERVMEQCAMIVESRGPFRRCPQHVRSIFYGACVYDGCALSPDVRPICEVLATLTKLCQGFGVQIDRWRTEEFCPKRCPNDSQYGICVSPCQRSCGQEPRPPNFECPHPCEEGCRCEEGYVLDSDKRCKRLEECGCFDDGYYHLNEEEHVREGCQEICRCVRGEPVCEASECHDNATCGINDGDYRCYCNEGFIGNGRECIDDPCDPDPCENDGICTAGEDGGSYECTCVGHWWGDHCELGVQSCSVSGHTHYNRFDGFVFDFYGHCKYILAQPCTEGDNFFRVIVENERDEALPRLPRTKALHIFIFDLVISLKQEMEFEVNGEEMHYPFRHPGILIDQFGWIVRVTTDIGLTVVWNGRDLVGVTLPSNFEGSTCGICGNVNNPVEGFGEYKNVNQYAMAWVHDIEDCETPDEPYEPCEERPCNLEDAVEKCSILLSPRAACPPGWFSVPSGDEDVYICYFVREAEERLTFAAADRECKSRGGQMYNPASLAQAVNFRNATEGQYDGSFWLACTDREEENHWMCRNDDLFWFNNTEEGYWPWEDGQPDNGEPGVEEDCLMVVDSTTWRDVSCYALATQLVCQLDTPRRYLTPFEECHEVVPPHPYFAGCVSGLCATLPDDDWLCSALTAYANVCRLSGVDIGLWRSRDLCSPSCPEYAYFSRCASPCPPTCADPERTCALPCVEGCQCLDGLVRQGDRCVPREQCGCLVESLGQFVKPRDGIFKPNCTEVCICRPGGELDCREVNCADHALCVPDEGNLGFRCRCEQGYSFVEDECQPDACSGVECANGGRCFALRDGEYSCLCYRGWAGEHCEEELGWCSIHGDPHYLTFDGLLYDFFGDCVYHLARHCGDDVEEPLFWILQKNERNVLQRSVASALWVEVNLDDLVVRLMRHRVVLVNGVRKNLPITNYEGVDIRLVGNKVVLHTLFGLWVVWDGYSFVDINLPGQFKNQTCGLCGNYDGDDSNDLMVRGGGLAQSVAEFGNSWAYSDEDCEPDDGSLNLNSYVEVCGDKLQRVIDFCSSLFTPFAGQCGANQQQLAAHFRNCLYDVCTLDDYHYGCAYASQALDECKAVGGRPEPRSTLPEPCRVNCPANSMYSFCMSPCFPTCDDVRGRSRPPCREDPCIEGCECNEGFVLSGLKCVREDECGCRDHEHDGSYYMNGEEFIRRDCKEKCVCEEGEIQCEPLDCHCEAECDEDDYGTYGCHCTPPYVGDGFECTVDPCYSNPCVNNGKCVVLEDWHYACVCKPQWTGLNCEIEQRVCSVYGSPQHFSTFDGANYNFFGTCKYLLAADCSATPLFSVVISNEPVRGRPGLTKLKDVYIQTDKAIFGLHQGKKVSLNGRPLSAPIVHENIVVHSGTHVLLTTPFGLTVRWDGYSDVDVALAGIPLQNLSLCGLCGNTDGDASNILDETPNGQRVSNSVDFGNSWSLEPKCLDEGSDTANACNGDIELAAAMELCTIILEEEGPFAACAKELNAERFLDNCVFAACASGNLDDRSVICRSLHTWESECLDQCIEVGPWRTPEFCAPKCPSGSMFRPNTSVCAKTCLEVITETSLPCPFPRQAGCECAPYHYLSGNECVPKEYCGCFHSDRYWQLHEVFVSPECESVCTCYPGNRVECEEKECSKNAFCGVRDAVYDCHCKKGYEDDGCGGCRPNPCYPNPCENDAECVIIKDDDFFCRCPPEFAGRVCNETLSRCTISGDPHYETFDRFRYLFNGECEYVLVHNCFDDDNPKFTVTQVSQRSQSDPGVISTNMIKIYVTGDEGYFLEIHQGRVLYINGVRLTLPVILPWAELHYSGSWIVLRDHRTGLVVRWDGDKNVEIFLRGNAGKVCGLCGTLDGDTTNDFLKQFTGEIVSDAVDFANSWKLNDTCEHAVTVPHRCAEDANKEAIADNACNIIRNIEGSLGACHEVVPFQPFYDKCVYDVCKSLPDATARCDHIRDYVQRCINEGVEIGPEWRQEKNCFLECPDNSHYSSCIGSCPSSCLGEILYQDPRRCFRYCNDGCECDEGYILSNDRCVRKEECGCYVEDATSFNIPVSPLLLPTNHVFMNEECTIRCQCGTDGNIACETITCHIDATCQYEDGAYQCVCNDGLLGDGLQCNISPCVSNPCMNTGTCYEDGTTAYYCVCTLGWSGLDCSQESRYCLTYGDPHYLTFDGRHYDFMGECSYQLAGECGASPIISLIQVNQRFENTVYTTMKELIVRYAGTPEIKLVPNQGVIIDGVPQVLPVDEDDGMLQIRRVGNYIVLKFLRIGTDVKWNGEHNADITIPNARGGLQICGLCGNANGNSADDFEDGDPLTEDTAVAFGNRQVTDDIPCPQEASYQPNPCNVIFDTESADFVCRPLNDQSADYPFQGCPVDVNAFNQACRYDVCAFANLDATEPVACGVIAAYAQLCQELGYDIVEWRSELLCSQTCPENAEYSLCANPCPPTCRVPDLADGPCYLRCAEGCTCQEGYYQEGDQCVPPSRCGCVYDNGNKYVGFNENFYKDSCSIRCTCSEAFGEVVCVEAVCHENATCVPVDGGQRCVCNEGYVGDGENCAFAECADNPCAEGAQCLRRLGGDPNYVCVCPEDKMGHNCDIPAEYNERSACYGAACNPIWFESPSYPEDYPNSWEGFYQMWVPTASYINVTFSPTFEIEEGRDFLYIGPGFQYPPILNTDPLSTVPGVVYQLHGYSSKGPLYIIGDSAWMYFQTDDLTAHRGWQAMLEAGFEALSEDVPCWDGQETRLSGNTWTYGKCDDCQCAAGAIITCSLMASKSISCVQNVDCPGESTCVPSSDIPLCAAEPCDGMICDVGTIYADCNENPHCAELTVTADLTNINPSATISDICGALIAAAELLSTEVCFTFECGVRRDGTRKKRAPKDGTLLLDIFLESASPSSSVSPSTSPGGMTPVDSLALSLFDSLNRHISDGSLPINITSVFYLGPRPSTVAPPTSSTEKVTQKVTVQPVETTMPTSTIIIIAVSSSLFLTLVTIMAAWCHHHGKQSSKKAMTFQGTADEAHTNEVFEMVDHGPAFSRGIPLDDGTGNTGNIYGVRYDLES